MAIIAYVRNAQKKQLGSMAKNDINEIIVRE